MILVALLCLGGQRVGLLFEKPQSVSLVDLLALSGGDTMTDPLPQLGARDLSGGGILHQVVDWDTADTTEPSLHVAKTNVEVLADTLLGNLAWDVHVEEIVGGDLDILAADEILVWCWHVLIEDFGGDGSKSWVGNPSSVVTSLDLTELIGVDALHGLVVGGLVILNWDLGGHSSHSSDLALMAGLDEKLNICVHEWDGHGDTGTIWKDEVWVLAELLDDGEDVIPTSAVKSGRVVSELEDDLIHLESGENGLDEDCTSDSASWDGNEILGEVENVVPETGLEVRLHLGEVEVWAVSTLDELLGVMEEVETEVEQGTGDWLAVNGEVLLIQVPSSWADDESWELLVGTELVFLSSQLEINLSADGIVKVDLSVDHVAPGWGRGVLETS